MRQGYALPEAAKNQWGCAPGLAYGPEVLGRNPNQGRSPVALVKFTRQGRALPHIGAAKPVRMTTRIFEIGYGLEGGHDSAFANHGASRYRFSLSKSDTERASE